MRAYSEDQIDQEDWEQFQRLDRLTDHWWWRPGWRPGRRYLTWYTVLSQASAAAAYARRLQAALDAPYLDLVPPDGFHITVQGVAFADEVSAEELEALHRRAGARCLGAQPFVLQIGPAAAYSGGVFLRASPWQPLQELRARLRRAIADVRGTVPDEPAIFKPHISLAYCNSDVPAQALVDRVRQLRRLPPDGVRVEQVQLLRLQRDAHAYRWDVDHVIEF